MPSPSRLITVAAVSIVAFGAVVAGSGPAASAPDPTVVAVGDIACQSFSRSDGEGACRSDEVADLITRLDPDRFLPLGDLQYSKGTLGEFQRVYDVQFGHLRGISRPAPGNHEYLTPGAAGYFAYWGSVAAPPAGYYSFDVGAWHIVSLNSEICGDPPGCGPGSPEYEWLRADLADHPARCTLAYQHHPRYDWRTWQKFVDSESDSPNGGSEVERYIDLWDLMDRAGVDILLVGHNHLYHRWAPQDAFGNRDRDGIRQFTVGTGGRSLYPLGKKPRPANLLAVQNKAFGVLELTLHATSYDYRWVGLPNDPAFRDAGSFACR